MAQAEDMDEAQEMWDERDMDTAAIVAGRTRVFPDRPCVELFRQADGCLEIRDLEADNEDTGPMDVVHICEPREFVAFLTTFLDDTPNLY